MKIAIINGPNLNLLGKRETSLYGKQDFESFFERLQQEYVGLTLHYFQSNHEGELIDKLHEIGFSYNGILLNAGAYTHTSIALADAIRAIETPVIEIHISNVYKRESYRHHSYLSAVSIGVIAGFGLTGYEMGLEFFLKG